MSVDVNTAEVRSAARKINRCENTVSSSAIPRLSTILNEVDDHFEGAAAEALKGRLRDIDSDMRNISEGLDMLYRALMRYADRIEEMDRRLADSL